MIEQVIAFLKNPDPRILAAVALGLWLFMMFFSKSKKNSIGRARFATEAEFKESQKDTLKKLNGTRERLFGKKIRRSLTLFTGLPLRMKVSPSGKAWIKPAKNTVLFSRPSEHFMVLGTTGAGKTRFFLNRLASSAVLFNLPIVAVDLKGDEEKYDCNKIAPTSEIAGFAIENGYEVFVVAPFFPDSNCINPIDLIRSRTDSATANQLADSYVSNDEGNESDIWQSTGSKTLAAAMLLSRNLKYGKNLAMTQQILARIAENPESLYDLKIGPYQKAAFATFAAAIKSPETASSVMFSAMNAINKLIIPEVTGVFCRETNIPIVLKPKQMVIFRIHPLYKSVVMPLMASCIENLLARNVYEGKHGGFVLLDELPQYYLPTLSDTKAVARSKDWCFASGAQGIKILEKKYGETGTAALFDNIQTEIIMRIGNKHTADDYADLLGQEDVQTSSETVGSNSSSTNTQQSQRTLITTQQLRGQPTGHALVLSPSISAKIEGKRWVKMPIWLQFTISKHEQKAMDSAKKTWLKYRRQAIAKSVSAPLSDQELDSFAAIAEKLIISQKKQKLKNIKGRL